VYARVDPPVDSWLALELMFLLGDDCLRVNFCKARIESALSEWSKLFERANVRLRTIYDASWFWPEHDKLQRRIK
jgi:hypothetical protein